MLSGNTSKTGQIFNCGSSLSAYTCASDDQQDFNNNSGSSSSCEQQQPIIMFNQASYDADESDNETSCKTIKTLQQSESAKEYFVRIRKQFPSINSQNIQSSPTSATATMSRSPIVTRSSIQLLQVPSSSTPTNSNLNSNNKQQPQPHYEMFKVVIPEQHADRSLKHTDSDSTQSTQSMSDDDDISFDCGCSDESREGIEEEDDTVEQQPMSILRRKQKLGIITKTRLSSRHGVRFHPSTKFPDPNELQYRRKKVPRLTSKQKQELILNNYFDNSTAEIILPHLSPKLLFVRTHNNNEFRDYSSSNNNSMSHKDTESRRIQKRLERRSQQQQYQEQDEQLQQQQQLSLMSSSDTSNGFYVFR
jgi:hypothetical protein